MKINAPLIDELGTCFLFSENQGSMLTLYICKYLYIVYLYKNHFILCFRHFRLILTPKKGILHSKFHATTVDAEGNEKPVVIGEYWVKHKYLNMYLCMFLKKMCFWLKTFKMFFQSFPWKLTYSSSAYIPTQSVKLFCMHETLKY